MLIDPDIEKLTNIAKWFATHWNTADIFWLTPKEGANSIQVKETIDFTAKSHLSAVGSGKLMIIADAAKMTIASQNKILKTIEDTTTDTYLLLASNDRTVLNTIKSRCVIIYPDPLPKNLTTEKLKKENKDSAKIFENVEKVLTCKTLNDALPYLPLLIQKDNIHITLLTFSEVLTTKPFTPAKQHAILNRLAIINRNISANCNAQNAFDTLLMEIFKEN